MTTWHINEISQLLTELDSSSDSGLSTSLAVERIAQYGYNELIERSRLKPFKILWAELTATWVLILIAAGVAAAALGETKNSLGILSAALLSVGLGFIQEYRAEKAVAALQKMSMPNVRMLRDGKSLELPARELVPGDIILLEAGNIVPADLRLLEAVNLRIQEAALTGESEGVEKHTVALSGEDLPLGDRRNMAYMGTLVTQGRGLALVIATGMQTELGRIANLIQKVEQEKNPLRRRLARLGNQLALIGAGTAALLILIGLLSGDTLRHLLLALINLAVAIVPEGLPAVVTIILALGAQRLSQRNARIRKWPAVETLGSVTVICSDKTGTLTENRMTVAVLDVADHALDLTEEVERDGTLHTTRGLGPPVQSSLSLAAIGGALCNDAKLIDIGDEHYHTLGDSTEGAMVVAAAKLGYWKSSLDASFPRSVELPFDSERKRMTTVHHLERYDPAVLAGLEVGARRYIAFTKGRVDSVLDITTHVWVDGHAHVLDEALRSKIEASNENLTRKGMRVLAVAFRLLDSIPEIIQTDLEQSLTLVGLFGMIDPPREEVKEAVAACRAAGIRPVMITRDHPLTAIEIARQLGIGAASAAAGIKALAGVEIENLTNDELRNIVEEVDVFARVGPEHKIRLVRALQDNGHIVAMTGDGVNDAPALRRADIGVAMGAAGSDVSKEASDLILLDDNFATIVAAVRAGRTVHDNIRRFVAFSVAGSIGKILVICIAPFLGKSLPLLPLQLLWLSVVNDGLLGLGLGLEDPEADSMNHPADAPTEGAFSGPAGVRTMWSGVLIGVLAIATGTWFYFTGRPEWQTMIFTSLAFMQVLHAFAARSERELIFKIGVLSNRFLVGMAASAVLLLFMLLSLPVWSRFFELAPLSALDFSIAAGSGLLVFAAIELDKWWKRRKSVQENIA